MNYESKIIKVANEFREKPSEQELNSIIELAKNNECGEALINLCTQIYEFDLPLSKKSSLEMEEMFKEMNLNQDHLDDLKDLVS